MYSDPSARECPYSFPEKCQEGQTLASSDLLSWDGGIEDYLQASESLIRSASIYTQGSQICGKLASEGRIVIAMDHHDGSGPAFAFFSTDGDVRHRFYVRDDILV